MKQSKYIYILKHKQISRSEMLDFIACNLTNDTFKISREISLDVANYDFAILAITKMQRIARLHRQYIVVGYDYIIEVKRNV